jgi:hypothetical protein
MSSPLDHIRLSLVELIDDVNDSNPDIKFDSQAAASNISNITLSDLREDELGNTLKEVNSGSNYAILITRKTVCC